MSLSLPDPSAPSRIEPEAILCRFEDAWCEGHVPAVEDFAPPSGAVSDEMWLRLVVGLIQIDLEYRSAASSKGTGGGGGSAPSRVEDYFARFPELESAPGVLPDLIAAEYRARWWAGDHPTPDEYARRFGSRAEVVVPRLAQIEAELAEESERRTPASATNLVSNGPPVSELLRTLVNVGIIGPDEQLVYDAARTGDSAARGVARRLLDLGRLSRFQADLLMRGRAGELVLGPYLLESRLGEGASGRVFKARHRPTGRTVALKVFRDDVLGELDEAGAARFRQEVEAAGRLEHPHVVRSLGAGSADGVNFLAMEYLEGTDLGRLVVETGPLTAARACEYVRQAALALQHLTDRGLVHRDVKPPNLFVTGLPADPSPGQWGVVKLLDVGLARLQLTDPARAVSPLTRTGDFLGTPDYMAPEQAIDPHAADVRADLYGLGCTWFFLLTGRPPFAGGTFVQKIDRHRKEPPPDVSRVRPDVSAETTAALRRLLAKRPGDRFQSPVELAEVLALLQRRHLAGSGGVPIITPVSESEAAASATGGGAKSRRSRWGRRMGAVLGAAVAATVVRLLVPGDTTDPAPSGRAAEELVEAGFQALEARERDPAANRGQLRDEVRGFRRDHFGTAWAERAAALLSRFPSPLDRLPAGPLPTTEALAAGRPDLPTPPAGLVAVLGAVGPKHWGAVTALALDPAGRAVASGGSDGSVMLWDADTGAARRTMLGHTQPVTSLAFRPDGRVVCSGGIDGTVRLWDVETGEAVRSLVVPGGKRVLTVAFSPNGRTVATAGGYAKSIIKLWDAASGRELRDLVGHTAAVESVRFHPTEPVLASAGNDGTVRLWDWNTGTQTAVASTGSAMVREIAFRPDGKGLAAGCDGSVQMWDRSGTAKIWDRPQPGLVRNVAFTPDGRTLAYACGRDAAVTLCAADTGLGHRTLVGHGDIITGVAVSPDGHTLISSSRDGTVKWWDQSTGRERVDIPRQQADADMVGFRDDGEVLVSAGKDGVVKFWESGRAAELRSVIALPAVARSVAMSWDGQTLACGGWDGRIKVWEVATGRQLLDFPAHPEWVTRLSFHPDGRTLASAGIGDHPLCLKLWDAATGRAVRTFPVRATQHRPFIRDVMFGGDGRDLAAVTNEGVVQLWDTASGGEPRVLQTGPNADYCAFALSPSGRVGVFGASDGSASVWNPATGAKLRAFPAHKGAVTAVAFRPDGRAFASAGMDGLVRLWDAAGPGVLRHEVRVGPRLGRVHQIAFCADGRHLATANGNGTVYVLRVPGAE